MGYFHILKKLGSNNTCHLGIAVDDITLSCIPHIPCQHGNLSSLIRHYSPRLHIKKRN